MGTYIPATADGASRLAYSGEVRRIGGGEMTDGITTLLTYMQYSILGGNISNRNAWQ